MPQESIPQFGRNSPDIDQRPGVYAVIIKDGKILVVKNKGLFQLPGGGIEEKNPEEQLRSEIMEETGYISVIDKCIGKANQVVKTKNNTLGLVNKVGTFYTAHVTELTESRTDDDHVPVWLAVSEYLDSPGLDAQKWAVKKVLN